MATAACEFLYLTKNIYYIKKEKIKKKEKKMTKGNHEPSGLHLRRSKSQHHEKSSTGGISLLFSDGLGA